MIHSSWMKLPSEQKQRTRPFRSRELLEGAAAFLEETAKETQIERNLDALPLNNKIFHKNWETSRDIASHDKLYNHHKSLIFACYKLYKYIDHVSRKH